MAVFEKRVQINQIIENNLPEFIRSEFPNAVEFLKQYYISQEYQGGSIDIAENLDQYLKLDNLTSEVMIGSTTLTSSISSTNTSITVASTKGFPQEYGLIKIDDEIITYTGILGNTFTGCIRGFSGITGYSGVATITNQKSLIFSTSKSAEHTSGSVVQNLSSLFLKEFYKKLKFYLTPGLENTDFYSGLNVNNFIKSARSFYQSKGVAESFRILFNVLYGENVQVFDLEQKLLKSSASEFIRREVIVAEKISGGDPSLLVGKTIYKSTDINTNASVSEVETIYRDGKIYYKISLFVGFDDRDLINGIFTVPGKTKVLESIPVGSSIISVDSTVGFGQTGTLISGNNQRIVYRSKTVNQFLDCSNVLHQINQTDSIRSDDFIYGYVGKNNSTKIEFRITGVVSDFKPTSDIYLINEGEKISVKNIGDPIKNPSTNKTHKQIFGNSWIYNTSSRYFVSRIFGSTFKLSSQIDKSSLAIGDTVEILVRGSVNTILNEAIVSNINKITNEVILNISGSFIPNPSLEYDIRRKLLKGSSLNTPLKYGNGKILSNVLNVYSESDRFGYVASNSIPNYQIRLSINQASIPNGSDLYLPDDGFNNQTGRYSIIAFPSTVPFIDGDQVIYEPSSTPIPGLIAGAKYYISFVGPNRIRLYESKGELQLLNVSYIEFNRAPLSGPHNFTLESHREKQISPKNILRKFPINKKLIENPQKKNEDKRETGSIGLLINGVEIVSPDSRDMILYGPLKKFEVINSGKNYDVINPPKIEISSPIGAATTALVQPVISGIVTAVYIDPQDFDIEKVISLSISGGNGSGCILKPVMGDRFRELEFDSRDLFFGGGLDSTDETITFISEHNLKNGEPIIYNQNGNTPIGISTFKQSNVQIDTFVSGAVYYVKVINPRTIQVYKNESNFNAGINTIGIATASGVSGGIHKFRTLSKNTIKSIKVLNPGQGYENRKLMVKPSGISTYYNTINFENHGFKNGDLIEYNTTGSVISGLSTTNQYYILKINDNSFKLVNAGVNTDFPNQQDYIRSKNVSLNSTGSGYQIFKYPDIKVSINVSYGSTVTGVFNITPVVSGKIISAYLYEPGTGYGSSLVNLEKKPVISLKNGKNAQVKPIIVNGGIIATQVLSGGTEYTSTPDLQIVGSGSGAILRPVIVNERLTNIIVINPGIGYSASNTSIYVNPRGTGAKFDVRVRSLTINEQFRFESEYFFDQEDGLTYNIIGYNQNLATNYFSDNGSSHSPIIGWAYDGNPIYGPYGYSDPNNPSSPVKLLKPGYNLVTSNVEDRPPLLPDGFFIEDYKYNDSGDLDYSNGRYCKTPDFINGTYAYFVGVQTSSITNQLIPSYPYFIGNTFKSKVISENKTLNQKNFDLNKSGLARNTFPYKTQDKFANNDFILESNESLTQYSTIESVRKGEVDSLEVIDGGDFYKVKENLIFDDSGVNGSGLSAIVSHIRGKNINKVESSVVTYENSVFVWNNNNSVTVHQKPFNLLNEGDTVIVSGLSSSITGLDGVFRVGIPTANISLFKAMTSTPGENIEDIYVSTIPNNISVGSSIKIDNEILTILNIYPEGSILRVKRHTVGAAHTLSSPISILNNRFDIRVEVPYFESSVDDMVYFNGIQSVGIGTTSGIQIQTSYTVGEATNLISIPTQSIYIPNHPFKTGQKVILSKHPAATPFIVGNDPPTIANPAGITFNIPNVLTQQSTVYVIKKSKDYIGLTTQVGLTTTSGLYFYSNGSNNFEYSIESDFNQLTGVVNHVSTKIITTTPHLLKNADSIDLNIIPNLDVGIGNTTPVLLKYDSKNAKLLVNPVGFSSTGINTITGRITITDHGFDHGQKVYYNSKDLVASGLSTGYYFVSKISSNIISLSETYYDTQLEIPNIVKITGIGGSIQELSKVNPPISVTKGNDLVFNLSDQSLEGFKLKLFTDFDYRNEFLSTSDSFNFNVSGVGTPGVVGIGTTSYLKLRYSSSLPPILYYALEKGGHISTSDRDVIGDSQITFKNSAYTGSYKVFGLTGIATNAFNISIGKLPEKLVYVQKDCKVLKYSTSSESVSGPIEKVKILFPGIGYKKVPKFVTVNSKNGQNANILPSSKTIGRIEKIRVLDYGYEYSSDKTLRPEAFISPTVILESSDTIKNVEVISGGKNYISAPDLIVYNPISKTVVDTASLNAISQNASISKVETIAPIYGLDNVTHQVFAINNSNGVGIGSIFSSSSGVVTCILQTPFVGFSTNIFNNGDQIFVEGIESVVFGTGFNSSDYEYQFFTVSLYENTNPAKLEFSIAGLTTNPGIAKTFQSGYASIVNKKDYPVFNVIQERSIFSLGEKLHTNTGSGFFERDLYVSEVREDFIKVQGTYELSVNEKIKGTLSAAIGAVKSIKTSTGYFEINYSNRQEYGWDSSTGKLSVDHQVLPDNDYYQNLSYTVKSSITYDKMVDPVNRLLHPAGLKNFSDTSIFSSLNVGAAYTATPNDLVILDIFDQKRVDTINNYDLVSDYDSRFSRQQSSFDKSKYLKFYNRNLTDYTLCKTNRALLIDDISSRFSSKGFQDGFIDIFDLDNNFERLLVQVIDPDSLKTEIVEVIVLTTEDNVIALEKSSVNTLSTGSIGNIEAQIDSFDKKSLRFIPIDPFNSDHDIKVLRTYFNNDIVGIGTISFGSVKLSGSNIVVPASGGAVSIASTIISYPISTFKSLFANIQVQNNFTKKLNYLEVLLDYDGQDTHLAEYYFDDTNVSFSSNTIGIVTASIDSVNNTISLQMINNQSSSILVRANIIGFQTPSGIGTYRFNVSDQSPGSERTIRLESLYEVGSTNINVCKLNNDIDSSVKSLIRVSCGSTIALHQILAVRDPNSTKITQYPFISIGSTSSGIGTFSMVSIGNTSTISFHPDPEYTTNITVQTYNEIFYTKNDFENQPPALNYGTSRQEVLLSTYDGINGNRANKVDFDLKYQGIPIYQKSFNPANSSQLNNVTGIFNIPNHFFRTGEELIYTPGSTFIGVIPSSVGIGSTANNVGVVTNKLPTYVYPIVIGPNEFRLSTRKEYAQSGIYVTFTDSGFGNNHKLDMTKKLERSVISLDGIIQQPITYTPIRHYLQNNNGLVSMATSFISLTGISTLQPRDILKVDNEFMKINSVGYGTTSVGPITSSSLSDIDTYPLVKVSRGSVGTAVSTHIDGSTAQVYRGSFNIADSKIYFLDPPKGNTRSSRDRSNLPYVRANFSGRTFLRNNYSNNLLFDDISDQFTGIGKTYSLTVQGANTTGMTIGNGILFINGIFQTPTTFNNLGNNYSFIENTNIGISSVVFTGISSENGSPVVSEFDINQNQVPRGGIIVSLGSTPGLGYAPLVGAKVRADLNSSGTITNITGISHTGPGQSISTALYNNITGIIEITTNSNHNFGGGDKVKLVGLAFTCPSSAGIISYFPSTELTYSYDIVGIISARSFTANVGTSTLPHTYIGFGTVFPWYNLNDGSGYRGIVSVGVTQYSGHTGAPASVTATVGAGGTLSFNVISGGSGYTNPTILVSEPSYENLSVIGVSRRDVGLTSETGRNMLLNINVGPASTVGVGSTLHEVKSFEISRPGYAFRPGDVIRAVGLVTAKGLNQPLNHFELTVESIFNDYFSAWQFGELDYIDSVKNFQDGSRVRFPLFYNGQLLSFQTDPLDPSSLEIDLSAILVIFINGVIQTPNISYQFRGGTSFVFAEAPQFHDKIDIFFYLGDRNVDVNLVDINETIKIGDRVLVSKNPNVESTISQTDHRTVFDISGSDVVETDTYVGLGVDEINRKPVEWEKQKRDLVIKGDYIYKSRESIEPQIYPTAKVIKDIKSLDTEIFVDDAQFFNYEENYYGITISSVDALIISGEKNIGADFTATVGTGGTISQISIVNPGFGYSSGSTLNLKISNPRNISIGIGSTATATALVVNKSISSVSITNPGFGYTNPPLVIAETPKFKYETVRKISNVQGFSGIITGIGTTSGTSGHPLALKFFYRADTLTTDDLFVGYPVCIVDTKVGNGVTSVDTSNSNTVGIGTTFLDNIYYVHDKGNFASDGFIICNVHSNSNIIGINTQSYSPSSPGIGTIPLGRISWGRLYNLSRSSDPVSIGVTGLEVDRELTNFPTIQRRTFGLRNNGSIRNRSSLN